MSWWQEQREAWAQDWDEVGNVTRRFIEQVKWLFGHATRIFVYAVLFGLLYVYWPTTNIFERPLGSLTLQQIGQTVFAIAAALLLVRGLFNPSGDEGVRSGWQVFGVLILFGIIATLFLWR